MKVVVNRCYGGFSLSDKAIEMIMNRKGLNCFRYMQTKYNFLDGVNEYTKCDETEVNNHLFVCYMTKDLGEKISKLPNEFFWNDRIIDRNDVDLVAVVEELGEKADGRFAQLKVVEIPDGVNWEIDDYDGVETIHEVHRSW